MNVTLSAQEVAAGAMVGVRRRYTSTRRVDTANQGKSWDTDIVGALGECAVAKAVGLYWSPDVNVFAIPDVGDSIHVRSTNRSNGCLIIRPDDPDGVYVLAVGEVKDWRVCGWISSDEGKTERFWRTDRGDPHAWWVPQSALRSIGELRRG